MGDEASQQEDVFTVLCSKRMTSSSYTFMTLPVWISCTRVDSPEILVYALLDTLSSNTFTDQDICEMIHAHIEPVMLKLSTMTDRNSIVNCECAAGLKVRGNLSQDLIELPPVYTQEYSPNPGKEQYSNSQNR